MMEAIGFDIYGTLVDPLEMNRHLRSLVGDLADQVAELWRTKQIEYSFRRGLMEKYQDFGTCTRQALDFAMKTVKRSLSEEDHRRLLDEYQNLHPFPDVEPGMKKLKQGGYTLVAFSNGVERTVKALLQRAGILPLLDGVVSVDDLRTFKPAPKVYAYLAQRLDRVMQSVWLVSSNPWDVIGAKSAGLKAAWVRRNEETVFDPWGIEPDVIVRDLEELSRRMEVFEG